MIKESNRRQSMYDELVTALRVCVDKDKDCYECPYYTKCMSTVRGKHKAMVDAADAIEALTKAAKAMHLWIFLNTGDEQKAYDECGLSEEMNAVLGYGGQFVVDLTREDDHGKDNLC